MSRIQNTLIQKKVVPPSALAELHRWGATVPALPEPVTQDTVTIEEPPDLQNLAAEVVEALDDQELDTERVTMLDALRLYQEREKQGKLTLTTQVSSTTNKIFYADVDSHTILIAWEEDGLEDYLLLPDSYFVDHQGVAWTFVTAQSLYYGKRRLFIKATLAPKLSTPKEGENRGGKAKK
jgi:hypothetical protein